VENPSLVSALLELVQHTWAVVVLIAVPVAGVVGFVVQTWSLRKARLEYTKLALEVERMRREAVAEAEKAVREARLVTPASYEEMLQLLKLHRQIERHLMAAGPRTTLIVGSLIFLLVFSAGWATGSYQQRLHHGCEPAHLWPAQPKSPH
jgi:hypothetical protein